MKRKNNIQDYLKKNKRGCQSSLDSFKYFSISSSNIAETERFSFIAISLNQRIRKDNKTGYKGIYIDKGVYRVQIRRNKKRYYFGSYKTLPEAVKALADARAMVEEAQPKEEPGFFQEE